jgi:NADH dehydrogenase
VSEDPACRVVIVGGGFAGLNAAKSLGGKKGVQVTLIDRRNHHLFQPLLYQVAMAGLSPAEIAAPIRSLLARYSNVSVVQGEVDDVDLDGSAVAGAFGRIEFDKLILAAGAQHSYFGREEWEAFAPGLKTLSQATEIRRRVLEAFERAETTTDAQHRRSLLTFVIVGGGPTGVELAGAIGEMSRHTLARDFRNIDPKLTRIILIEAGPRILTAFTPESSSRATRDLEKLGVQVWTESRVTRVDERGVGVGEEAIEANTVLWAAGVQASSLGRQLGAEQDRAGRVKVEADLSITGHRNVFVLGDQAHVATGQDDRALPSVAPVAMQQGRYAARNVLDDLKGRERRPFRYVDKGSMATIGRSRAVLETGRLRLSGFVAWMGWLLVHIYYLSGFKNRLFVLFSWAWSYLSFARGARLIVSKDWRSFAPELQASGEAPSSPSVAVEGEAGGLTGSGVADSG